MNFPDFDNDIQINDETITRDDIYKGNFSHNEMFYAQPIDSNFGESRAGLSSFDWASPTDPEEQKRLDQRAQEERERRDKLTERIKLELEAKQENRKSAIEWIQRWEENRHSNTNKKKDFNKANEEEYLKSREQSKQGNLNPWDKVIEHIQLKESEHKGSRDISRMKSVILQRKMDFINLKMK